MLPDAVIGAIALWHGSIVSIPSGWNLCDGTNGTPDLRDRFIVGAGDTYSVNDTEGNTQHDHDFTGDGHQHSLPFGSDIEGVFPGSYVTNTDMDYATGTTDNAANLPTYYALAYIMFLGD